MQRAKNFRDKRRPSPLNVDLAKENGIQVFFVVFSFITFKAGGSWVVRVLHRVGEKCKTYASNTAISKS